MEDIFSGIAIRPDMLKDLFAVSQIDHNKAKAIAEKLKSLTGLNEADSIRDSIKSHLEEAEKGSATAVWRALVNLDSAEVATLLKTLGRWVAKEDARKEVFTEDVITNLKRNLDVLIADFPAIEMMQKANSLVRDTSGELKDLKFVCDLRPVFNDERTNVDAFVLVANMRMICLGQNGDKSVCEIALTEEELLLLKEKTDRALVKMKILKKIGATLDPSSGESE